MIDITILGITLQENGTVPVLLLYPHDTEKILSLRIGASEAFAISSYIHSSKSHSTSQKTAIAPTGEKITSASAAQDSSSIKYPSPQSIQQTKGHKLLGHTALRPMTHDLFLRVIEAFGGQLVEVEIVAVVSGVHYANLVIVTEDGLLRIDCKPSDGIALAVRCDAIIRCSRSVLAYADRLQDVDVMDSLPEHIRLLATSWLKVTLEEKKKEKEPHLARVPQIIEAALATKSTQIVQQELARGNKEQQAKKGSLSIFSTHSGKKGLTVAQLAKELQQFRNTHENSFAELAKLPQDAPAIHTGFFTVDSQPIMAMPDNDEARWNTLLHLLSPATKEHM